MSKGRIAELPPPLELAREKPRDVVARRELDRARVRLERLHEHAARRVAAAPARELGEELERALFGAEVGQSEPGVGVNDGRERNTWEVMTLCDHLRPDEHDAIGRGEARQRGGERTGARDGVGVEPDALELRQLRLQLPLEPLRARTEPRQLRRAAARARVRLGLGVGAVVATQVPVAVEYQRDVAVVAAERRATGAAVQCRRDTAPVEQEDRLAAAVDDAAELRQQRCGKGVARLAAQVDDAHGRKRSGEAPAELEPLEPPPTLRARGRAAEDGDRANQRGAL